jgi:hypothetical protein
MSIGDVINSSLDPNKQPNFYDGQQLDVDDLESLQIFLNTKTERAIENIGFNGTVEGLKVTADSVAAEPFEFPTVAQSSTNPSLQNFRDFPEDILDVNDVRMYQVFQAKTNNIQRFDLKLQLIEGTGTSTLVVELVKLTVPSNPLSDLSLDVLFVKQFEPEEIPSTVSDGRLTVDVSSINDNQGITLVPNDYYAIQIRFIRETNSQDRLRVFHSNIAETAAVDASLGAHFFVNGDFQQGLFDENAQLIQILLYHKVFTSAVQIAPGEAYFKGEHIKVIETQRFLSLVDRRNITDQDEFTNFVAIKFVLDSTDPELHPRTGNSVDSRFNDTFETKVFTAAEWATEAAKAEEDKEWLLLAIVTDRNVVPFEERFEFNIDDLTNLAYNDWLNPCVVTPSLAALNIKTSRPDDFVFFIDNVPTEVPLLDDNLEQVFSELGEALTDRVVRVFLVLYLDAGVNERRFEMALNSSTATTPPFNSYFITITDPEGELIPGLANFAFDKNEITPNTFYNYVAETEKGRFIFIQDFNTQIRTPDPVTGILSLTRERQFEVNLNAGSLTAVINEDLRLGDPIVPFGNVGQKVTGLESIIQVDEVPGRNGTTASKTITPTVDTLLQAALFKFEPLPMSFENGDPILDTDGNVTNAVNADDIIIEVNTVPILYSGTEGPERGGTGAPHTVSGQILFSDDPGERLTQMQDLATSLGISAPVDENDFANFVGLRVTVRDSTGRDNSQQNIVSVTQIDGGKLVYRVIAMGRGTDSPAGFSNGETGNLYIENRLARDIAGVPLQFTYTPFGASIMNVRRIDTLLPDQTVVGLGTGEQWFGERKIVFATTSTGLAADEVGIHPSVGQVFWNAHDENLLFNVLNATATIRYFHLDEVFAVVNFYQSRLIPWGTADGCPIVNEDPSVQTAVANGWIILRVDGQASYEVEVGVGPTIDLSEPNNYVAMTDAGIDQSLLPADKIAIDPDLGRIVFGTDISPDPSRDVTVTYYHLRPVTTCATSALGQTYDVRFDFNLDGRVDETDLNLFQTAFGSSTGDTNYNSSLDFNNDGTIGNEDFQEFLDHFGTVAAGEPSFKEATQSRLNAILVFRKGNTLRRFNVIRAVSEPSSTQFPLGRTVLFFDQDTPIRVTDTYQILFGFAAELVTGINTVTVTTNQQVTTKVNRDIIEVINENDPLDNREIIDVESLLRTAESGAEVFDNVITFSPSITESSTFVVRALWQENGIASINRDSLIRTVFYEKKHRRRLGPFMMTFNSDDYASDGTQLTVRFATNPEATFADGTVDTSGLHLDGVPIEDIRFAIMLFIPVDNNKVNVWKWHHFVPKVEDRGIKLEFNEFLSLDSRFRGKNGVPVLQPFGVGQNQVDLRPKFAGGDVENDLSNLVVLRDDFVPNTPPLHNHTSDEEGGVLTSANISFEDPEARFNTGNVTEVIYQLQDNTQLQLNNLLSQITDLQIDASRVIVTDTQGCLDAPSGQLTLADALVQIINKISWDELNNCP